MAKKFFYVCGGVLMLALAFHFGAMTATAQAPGNPVVGITSGSSGLFAVTANGDSYARGAGGPWFFLGNVFTGAPVEVSQPSWGQVKSRYREQATPGTESGAQLPRRRSIP